MKILRLVAFLFGVAALFLGCGGGGASVVPTAASHTTNPATCTVGTAIAPSLPPGLSLNPTMGVISGTQQLCRIGLSTR